MGVTPEQQTYATSPEMWAAWIFLLILGCGMMAWAIFKFVQSFHYYFGIRCDKIIMGIGGVPLSCERYRYHLGPHRDPSGAEWSVK